MARVNLKAGGRASSGSRHLLSARFALDTAAAPDSPKLDSREFSGTAAVYGNVFDRWDCWDGCVVATTIAPGAFSKSVATINAQHGSRAGKVPLFWEHYLLLGRSLSLTDTPDGLLTRARVTDARELDLYLAWILDGAADGMSIGFDIVASEPVTIDGKEVERVTEGDLGEITACVWGANPLAGVDAAASRLGFPRELLAGRVLSAANEADLNCITADAARVLARTVKEQAKEDESASASASASASEVRTLARTVQLQAARLDGYRAELDTLAALAGLRKE